MSYAESHLRKTKSAGEEWDAERVMQVAPYRARASGVLSIPRATLRSALGYEVVAFSRRSRHIIVMLGHYFHIPLA